MAAYLKCSCTHCDGHIEFPAEAAGVAVNCPHCGEETLLTSPAKGGRGKVMAVVAALVVVVAAAGAGWFFLKGKRGEQSTASPTTTTAETPGSETPASAPTAEEPIPKTGMATPAMANPAAEELKLVQFSLPKTRAKGSSVIYLQGTVTNQAKVQYFSVKIEFDLLDAKGAKVGTAKDQLANLAPRGVWNFKALVVEKQAVSAKLVSLKGERE
jgi:ribosomal protein S27E